MSTRVSSVFPKRGHAQARPAGDKTEAALRVWVLLAAAVIGVPLLVLGYYKLMFPGLVNADAMDFAQLARNIQSGHGFTTLVLRPLALTHGASPLHQPDLTHGPLYPVIMAIAFAALGAKDDIVCLISAAFFLLTLPVLYRLAFKMFGAQVARITTAVFALNSLMLEYSISGLHITLFVFLSTSLLLVMYELATDSSDRTGDKEVKLPTGRLVMAGVLSALMYLTEPVFFWFLPVIAVAAWTLCKPKRWLGLAWTLIPMAILTLPWMAHNFKYTGNPVFGLRGIELFSYTKGELPELTVYRMSPHGISPNVALFKAVVNKVTVGIGQIIQTFPQVTASWILAFLLPSLLFRFTDQATNTLRRVMMWCFLALVGGIIVFGVDDKMPLFMALIPTMLIFSVAYLLHLLQQARLTRNASILATLLLCAVVIYPL